MREVSCSQEMAVTQAARTGEWNNSLEAHVASCPNCKVVMQTVAAMRSLVNTTERESPMPEATRMWCLALLEQKQMETARARRSLMAMEFATSALITLACVGWLAWYWAELTTQLSAWLTKLGPQLWQAGWYLAGQTPAVASVPAVSVLIMLLAVAAVLLAHPLLAED